MVQATIQKIEEKIKSDNSLQDANKANILEMINLLKSEIAILSKTQNEQAESIVGFMERTTHEVMRKEKNPSLLKIAADGLSASVHGFEESHPKLVEKVNYIANALANMGI